MSQNENEAQIQQNFYCIWVKTGFEEAFIKEIQPLIDLPESSLKGVLHFLKKQMRLKTGKMYYASLFPGYVFLETSEADITKFAVFKKGKGFIRFLPQNTEIEALSPNDLEIVRTILKYGTTIPIVHASFDENDRIVILDGPFKELPGKVVAVNRRNKRVNLEVELVNGIRLVGLTYEEVQKI